MNKEFTPYEQALALKELGFDEKCGACYYKKFDNEIGYHKVYRDFNFVQLTVSAPTFSQAFRWFREKHGLYSHVRESYSFDNTLEFVSQINGSYVNHGIADKPVNRFDTYEEAELECLKKLIEIVKEKY